MFYFPCLCGPGKMMLCLWYTKQHDTHYNVDRLWDQDEKQLKPEFSLFVPFLSDCQNIFKSKF